jgi:hypothetical protein
VPRRELELRQHSIKVIVEQCVGNRTIRPSPKLRVDGGLEGEFAAGDLELLDEVGGPGEQDPRSVLDQGEADACGEMISYRL